jgi:hypothetical protein
MKIVMVMVMLAAALLPAAVSLVVALLLPLLGNKRIPTVRSLTGSHASWWI